MKTIKQRKLEFYAELDSIEDGLSDKFAVDVNRSYLEFSIDDAISFNWPNSSILLWSGLVKDGCWRKVYYKLVEREKTRSISEQSGKLKSNPDYVVIPKLFPQFSGSYNACKEFIGENFGSFRLLPKEQWDEVNKMLSYKIEVPDKVQDEIAELKREFKRKVKILMDSID